MPSLGRRCFLWCLRTRNPFFLQTEHQGSSKRQICPQPAVAEGPGWVALHSCREAPQHSDPEINPALPIVLPASSPSPPLPSLLIGPVPLPGVVFLKFPSFNSSSPLVQGPTWELNSGLWPLNAELPVLFHHRTNQTNQVTSFCPAALPEHGRMSETIPWLFSLKK